MIELGWLALIALAVSSIIKLIAVAKWKRMSDKEKEALFPTTQEERHERWKDWRR